MTDPNGFHFRGRRGVTRLTASSLVAAATVGVAGATLMWAASTTPDAGRSTVPPTVPGRLPTKQLAGGRALTNAAPRRRSAAAAARCLAAAVAAAVAAAAAAAAAPPPWPPPCRRRLAAWAAAGLGHPEFGGGGHRRSRGHRPTRDCPARHGPAGDDPADHGSASRDHHDAGLGRRAVTVPTASSDSPAARPTTVLATTRADGVGDHPLRDVPSEGPGVADVIGRAFGWFATVHRTCTRFDRGSPLMTANARPDEWVEVPTVVARRGPRPTGPTCARAGGSTPGSTTTWSGWAMTAASRSPTVRWPRPPRPMAGSRSDAGRHGSAPVLRTASTSVAGPSTSGASGRPSPSAGPSGRSGRGSPTSSSTPAATATAQGAVRGGTGRRAGAEDPSGGDLPVAVLALSDAGCATSSTRLRRWRSGGDRVHHLIDPSTGRPGGTGWPRSPWSTPTVPRRGGGQGPLPRRVRTHRR